MKKRVLSMILMVCMIVSLLVGFTVSAAAEAGIVTYTLKDGDTVLKACQKNGIDFYAKQKLIAAINNITDYRSLPVGFTVKLPTDAYVASASTAAATSAAAVGSSAVAVPGAASAANIAVGDTVSYYLIKYQMRSGDTVADVCNSLGVNFGTYSSMIKDINGIGNWNNVRAGSTILIPSATTPPVGTSCYAVVAHTVASGETASSICASYGMSYGANESLLKAINNKSNLNSIMRGSSFMVPVSTTITGTGTSITTSTSATSTTSKTPAATGTVSSNDTKYSIKAAPSSNGSFELRLNDKAVTEAAAGEKITLEVVPNINYVMGSWSVVADDGTKIAGSNKTFTMPACGVKVTVNFVTKVSYPIHIVTPITNGCISVQCNGKGVSEASGDSIVTVVATPNEGYELVKAEYSTDPKFAAERTWTLPYDGTFKMPQQKVYVRATFKAADVHKIKLIDDPTLSTQEGEVVQTTVAGNPVTQTRASMTVTATVKPKNNYEFKSLKVYKDDGSGKPNYDFPVAITNNKANNTATFVMPGFDVVVFAEFEGKPVKITADNTEHSIGTISFYDKYYNAIPSGSLIKSGSTAIIKVSCATNYTAKSITINGTDKTSAFKPFINNQSSDYHELTYEMTVTEDTFVAATFEKNKSLKISLDPAFSSTFGSVSLTVNGHAAQFDSPKYTVDGKDRYISVNDTIAVTVKAKSGYDVWNIYYKATNGDGPSKEDCWAFPMPDSNVTIYPIFVKTMYKLNTELSNGSVKLSYEVKDATGTRTLKTVTDKVVSENTTVDERVPVGTVISVSAVPNSGYQISGSLKWKNLYKTVDLTGTSFTTEETDTTIVAAYKLKEYKIPTAITGTGTGSVAVDVKRDGSEWKNTGLANRDQTIRITIAEADRDKVTKVWFIDGLGQENILFQKSDSTPTAELVYYFKIQKDEANGLRVSTDGTTAFTEFGINF